MELGLVAGLALAGYLIGSVSFARLVGAKVAPGDDLSTTTLDLPGEATIDYSGVSATSIAVRSGPKWGIVTGIADMAKAFVPTLVVRLVWPDDDYYLVVAIATVVGHNYPIYYGFKGGRGQTPIYGSLLAIDWLALPVTTAVGTAIGLFVFRDMFVAYALGMWLLIPWFWWRADTAHVIYAVAVNLLFAVATIPEMGEYFAKRKAGELEQVGSWRQFKRSHPAMRGGAASGDADEPTDS